ncbi:hypothetical protein AWM75_00780 [Aerococcus urinaehominis]|uniref:Poly-beta-1,6-N-acetyl-D-glucosamine synthase n=1 Tax=Aerococcus urinaehominis TaxID=128944 RepID=A0A109RGK8_9LACT|nr:poly-beta-1,6-N-acetyl-D-glucosamine synthase [Aerococcus urinaehominis]AMB98616.1 hypothetical protein AWM75_00780 [Aerococcus urinaehominis]SDL95384.1 biofilm PGA synthesis N-glycosyltransferase PgaC [Aerococcus urinaehominis]
MFKNFILYYPLVMTLFYWLGMVIFYLCYESRLSKQPSQIDYTQYGISVVISCYNESEHVRDTIVPLCHLDYPCLEIIAVNDGSRDNTGEILDQLAHDYGITVLHLSENLGKGNAMNQALDKAKYDYILTIDADTQVSPLAPYYLVSHFNHFQNVGVVTGNPRIKNKENFLSKMQVIEFSSIIGSNKRTQMLNGYINTISGVFAMFSRQALVDVGGWDIDMITEDIAISWKLQLAGYHVHYEPRATCQMVAPTTVAGLLKQRKRWAQGGMEVMKRYLPQVFKNLAPAFWLLALEQVLSIVWILSVVGSLILFSANYMLSVTDLTNLQAYSGLSIVLFLLLNLVLTLSAFAIDSRYEPKILAYTPYYICYPAFYWLLNAISTISALPNALTHKTGVYATWSSPDRGGEDK